MNFGAISSSGPTSGLMTSLKAEVGALMRVRTTASTDEGGKAGAASLIVPRSGVMKVVVVVGMVV